MQAKFLVGSLLLVTRVLAGGFAGALERVWLFYAYQIDGLNAPADRTLGWKCLSWDHAVEKCRINQKTGQESWVECKGTMPGRRCTFSQFLNHFGGAVATDRLVADKDGNLLDLKATDPDPRETGKKVYAHYILATGDRVKDYQSYRVLYKASGDYLDCINKVGDIVADAGAAGKATGDNKRLFDRFAETTTQIKQARVGDHGKHIIGAAEQALGPKGITVKTETVDPGHNPAVSTELWETVNWQKTMSDAVDSGAYSPEEILKITGETQKKFYDEDHVASEHRAVIQSYEIVENKANGCI